MIPIFLVIGVGWVALTVVAVRIAERKGRDSTATLLASIFLSPLIGLLVAVAQAPDPAGQGKKKCPQCAEFVAPDAAICRYCRCSFATEPREAASPTPETLPAQPVATVNVMPLGPREMSLVLAAVSFLILIAVLPPRVVGLILILGFGAFLMWLVVKKSAQGGP